MARNAEEQKKSIREALERGDKDVEDVRDMLDHFLYFEGRVNVDATYFNQLPPEIMINMIWKRFYWNICKITLRSQVGYQITIQNDKLTVLDVYRKAAEAWKCPFQLLYNGQNLLTLEGMDITALIQDVFPKFEPIPLTVQIDFIQEPFAVRTIYKAIHRLIQDTKPFSTEKAQRLDNLLSVGLRKAKDAYSSVQAFTNTTDPFTSQPLLPNTIIIWCYNGETFGAHFFPMMEHIRKNLYMDAKGRGQIPDPLHAGVDIAWPWRSDLFNKWDESKKWKRKYKMLMEEADEN